MFAALRAGIYPKKMPMKVQTANDTYIDQAGMLDGIPMAGTTNSLIPAPTSIPMMPPVTDIITDSIRN